MRSKIIVSFLLGLALASGIWGTILVSLEFAILIVLPGALVLIAIVYDLLANWYE